MAHGLASLAAKTHTVSGLLMRKLRRIPEEGDIVEDQGYRFIVESLKGRRAERVRIDKTETESVVGEGDGEPESIINET